MNLIDFEKLKYSELTELKKTIKIYGINGSARKIECPVSYISKIMNDRIKISFEKIIKLQDGLKAGEGNLIKK